MPSAVKFKTKSKVPKSYTIEPDVDKYVSATKGRHSASERVNNLLKKAIIQERHERLDIEAASFFASENHRARTGTRAFQKAAKRTLERD